jgi:hypothetical protein
MSKVWLITGASRGLGRAFTEGFSRPGTVSWPPPGIPSNSLTQAKYAVAAAMQSFGGLDCPR